MSTRLYFLMAENIPKGMAMTMASARALPTSRISGTTARAMIALTGTFCFKLTPKLPWVTSSFSQIPYCTYIGSSRP